MEAQFGAGDVAIDQAGVGIVIREPALAGGALREREEASGNRGPRRAGRGIVRVIAIAGAVGHPAHAPAIGHRHRHSEPAGRDEMAKRRRRRDGLGVTYEIGGLGEGEAAEHDGAFFQRLERRRGGIE